MRRKSLSQLSLKRLLEYTKVRASADDPVSHLTEPYDRGPAQALMKKHTTLSFPYVCVFGDAELIIYEGVFCPTLTNVSSLLLEAADFRRGERVLDVFAGSGALGINAALRGCDVVTIDISQRAVECTVENAAVNGVSPNLDARQGTLRSCLRHGETFDVVVANPPLLPGEPSDSLSGALFDPGLGATVDLLRALPNILSPGGRCYLLTSDVFDRLGYNVDHICGEAGLVSSIASKADFGYETYRVHEITS